MREMKHLFAGDHPAGVADGVGLVFGDRGGLLLFILRDLLLVLDQRFNAGNGGLDARLHDVLGEFLVVEDHHFLDVANAALEVFAEGGNLADDNGRAGDGLEDAHLAALDALGDLDLALAGEQGNRAHLAQVHADRVVGLLQGSGRQVQFDVLAVFQVEVLVAELGAVQQVNALGADGGDQVVQIFGRRTHLIRQHVVDVAVGEVALFLAHFDQSVDVVIVVVVMVVLVIGFKFVVNCQDIPTLHCKAVSDLLLHKIGRNRAWAGRSAQKIFPRKIPKCALADTIPR